MPVDLPSRLGNEFAGVVEHVGPAVTELTVGDAVLGFEQMACYAQSVVVSADHVVRKPPGMSWETAGVLSASGQTAHTAIERLDVGPEDTLLIHAAAGGVGTFAVQVALARGATVIGTARPANHEYLRSLGASPVAYGADLEAQVRSAAPRPVTTVLDCIGGDALAASIRLVPDRRRIVTITDRINGPRLGIAVVGTDRSADRLTQLVDLHERGQLRASIADTYALTDAPDAHRAVETGHVRGKVVLVT